MFDVLIMVGSCFGSKRRSNIESENRSKFGSLNVSEGLKTGGMRGARGSLKSMQISNIFAEDMRKIHDLNFKHAVAHLLNARCGGLFTALRIPAGPLYGLNGLRLWGLSGLGRLIWS